MRYLRSALVFAGLVGVGSALGAQQSSVGACATPDSVAFRGSNVPDDQLRNDVGIAPKSTINGRVTSKAIKDLYATNLFDYVATSCEVVDGKTLLVFHLRDRRVLSDVKVVGPDKVSLNSVKERVDLIVGKPIDPAQVAKAVARIDSLYQSEGYYLATVHVDTLTQAARDDPRFSNRRGAPAGHFRRRDRREQGAERQDDRQRDCHEAGRVLLVAKWRVRSGQIRRGSWARRSRSSTRRMATSTCRWSRTP